MPHTDTGRTDQALARRLERAEASGNAAFVEARAELFPSAGAIWCEVSGAYAMFDGVGSPLTQSFGFGMFAPATEADLDSLERFFFERGADANHEVSPLADPAHLALLSSRGYRPVEYTTIMHRQTASPLPPRPSQVLARPIRPGEETLWADLAASGWGETPELAAFIRGFGGVSARSRGTVCFLAELDGVPVATGAMALHGGVALMAGASTLPTWRGRGAQAALLAARLRHAAEAGCDLAAMGAHPGSTSQLNAERQGFRIAYTRVKWQRVVER